MTTVKIKHRPDITYRKDSSAPTHAYPDDKSITYEPLMPDDFQTQGGVSGYVPTYHIYGF